MTDSREALRDAIEAGWLRSPLLVALHSFPEGRHELEALAEKIWDAATEAEHEDAYMQGHSEGHDAGFADGVEHERRESENREEKKREELERFEKVVRNSPARLYLVRD